MDEALRVGSSHGVDVPAGVEGKVLDVPASAGVPRLQRLIQNDTQGLRRRAKGLEPRITTTRATEPSPTALSAYICV
jgi:hypothetical protein